MQCLRNFCLTYNHKDFSITNFIDKFYIQICNPFGVNFYSVHIWSQFLHNVWIIVFDYQTVLPLVVEKTFLHLIFLFVRFSCTQVQIYFWCLQSMLFTYSMFAPIPHFLVCLALSCLEISIVNLPALYIVSKWIGYWLLQLLWVWV